MSRIIRLGENSQTRQEKAVSSRRRLTVLGVDPGIRKTGFAVIVLEPSRLVGGKSLLQLVKAWESIRKRGENADDAMDRQVDKMLRAIVDFHPDLLVVEGYVLRGPARGATRMSQLVGGMVQAARTSVVRPAEIHLVGASKWKKWIKQEASAPEGDVPSAVHHLITLPRNLGPHATDAVGLALFGIKANRGRL